MIGAVSGAHPCGPGCGDLPVVREIPDLRIPARAPGEPPAVGTDGHRGLAAPGCGDARYPASAVQVQGMDVAVVLVHRGQGALAEDDLGLIRRDLGECPRHPRGPYVPQLDAVLHRRQREGAAVRADHGRSAFGHQHPGAGRGEREPSRAQIPNPDPVRRDGHHRSAVRRQPARLVVGAVVAGVGPRHREHVLLSLCHRPDQRRPCLRRVGQPPCGHAETHRGDRVGESHAVGDCGCAAGLCLLAAAVAGAALLPGHGPGDEGEHDQHREGADKSAPAAALTLARGTARVEEHPF